MFQMTLGEEMGSDGAATGPAAMRVRLDRVHRRAILTSHSAMRWPICRCAASAHSDSTSWSSNSMEPQGHAYNMFKPHSMTGPRIRIVIIINGMVVVTNTVRTRVYAQLATMTMVRSL